MSIEAQSFSEVSSPVEPRQKAIRTIYVVAGVLVVLGLAGLLIWGVVWLARTQPAEVEVVRDLFIIGLALESCLFGVVLMLLLVMIIRLVNMLEFEIKPILEQTNETIGMVRGTTNFVSQNVVRPVATASGYVAAVRRGLQVLFGNPRRNLE